MVAVMSFGASGGDCSGCGACGGIGRVIKRFQQQRYLLGNLAGVQCLSFD